MPMYMQVQCRMTMLCSVLMFSALGVAACGETRSSGDTSKDPPSAVTLRGTNHVSSAVEWVSLIAIIADPERFHGREVWVTGFVSTMEDCSVVAINKESLEYSIGLNCLYLDLSRIQRSQREKFKVESNLRCCSLRGFVDARKYGPDGTMGLRLYSCTLTVNRFTVEAERKRNRVGEAGRQ